MRDIWEYIKADFRLSFAVWDAGARMGVLIGALIAAGLAFVTMRYGVIIEWKPEIATTWTIFAAVWFVLLFVIVTPFRLWRQARYSNAAVSGNTYITFIEFLRRASNARWSTDVHAMEVGDNNLWELLHRLRQSAGDGLVQLRGRRYRHEHSKAIYDNTPIVDIPPAHFHEYWIDVFDLDASDNYLISTKKSGGPAAMPDAVYSFRDIHINEVQVSTWLRHEGKAPEPASFHVNLTREPVGLETFESILAIIVKNIRGRLFDNCLVKLEEMASPSGRVLLQNPFALRTDGQIRGSRSGAFTLRVGESKIVPILYRNNKRGGDKWYVIDENKRETALAIQPLILTIGIYGSASPGVAKVNVWPGMKSGVEASLSLVEGSDLNG